MRKINKLIHLFIITLFLCQCTEKKSNSERLNEIKDGLGRTVSIKESPDKIIALTPSITEILFLICPDSVIIGRTQNCDYPARVFFKPVVNNYPVDFEKLSVLKPDLVFAKEGIISIEDADKIQSMGVPVFYQKYETLDDLFKGISTIGAIVGQVKRATFVVDSLKRELELIKKNKVYGKGPKVLSLISVDKIYAFGKDSYMTDMIQAAGGVNAMTEIFNNSFPQITSEYLLGLNPDIIYIVEGSPLNLGELYPELKNVNAVKYNRIYSVPADLVSRPGPRIVEGIKYLHKEISSNEE